MKTMGTEGGGLYGGEVSRAKFAPEVHFPSEACKDRRLLNVDS